MIQSRLTPPSERIIEPMITLARCSKLQRIIVAGSRSGELMLAQHRRGYIRVATTSNCGLPSGQYDVSLVDWRERSIKALETTLDWLVNFCLPQACWWSGSIRRSAPATASFAPRWERHGLLVETGTIHQHGSAVCAQRCEIGPLRKVA